MNRYHRTEGVCLRRLDYSNTSQVATFLTRDRGCLSFLAKGLTRAPRKGIRCGFELLERYELVYLTRRTGSLLLLAEQRMIESFHGVREALERTLCAYYAAELALNFTAEEDPCPRFYELMVESLRRFASGEALGLSVLLLEIGALKEHGSCPTFDECAECGARLVGRAPVAFSPAHGGPLCRRCLGSAHAGPTCPVVRVARRRLDLLHALAGGPSGPLGRSSASARSPAGDPAAAMPPAEIVAVGRVLRFHMRWLLGKELAMWKYVQDRHLSRTLGKIRRSAG